MASTVCITQSVLKLTEFRGGIFRILGFVAAFRNGIPVFHRSGGKPLSQEPIFSVVDRSFFRSFSSVEARQLEQRGSSGRMGVVIKGQTLAGEMMN